VTVTFKVTVTCVAPQEKERVAREIEPSADGAIDRLVYELSPEGDDIWVE